MIWLLIFVIVTGYLIAMRKEIIIYFKMLWEKLKEINKTDFQINEQINFNVKPYAAGAKWVSKVFYKFFVKTSFGKRLFLKYVGIKNNNY